MKLTSTWSRRARWSITAVAVVAAALATAVSGAATAEAATATCGRIVWSANAQIVTADADGANQTALTFSNANYEPQWSPDGTRLTWRRSVNGAFAEIVVADANGGSLAVISGPAGANFSPQWSPNGAKIAWEGDQTGANDGLFVADASGANRINLARVGAGADLTRSTNPSWSPDGTRIAWVATAPGESFRIVVADVDGTNRAEIAGGRGYPEWSPDGARIAWATGGEIWVADADGDNRIEISQVATGPDPTANGQPQWSPDGSRIVWSGRNFDSQIQQIYVSGADGTNRIELSTAGAGTAPVINEEPQWSPDGNWIVWSGRDAASTSQQILVAMAADGSLRSQISSIPGGAALRNNSQPQWFGGSLCGGTPGPGGFTDVAFGSFYADAVVWLKDENITTGRTATTFAPDETVTRGQMAAFLHRLAGSPAGSPAHGFTDVPAGAFYADAVAWLKTQNVTTGTSPTTFAPDETVTRGQMAAFLHRLAGSPAGSPAHGFTDVPAGAFYASAVGWLKAQNITTGTSPTVYSPGDTVTRGQMAAFLFRMATDSDWVRPS